MRTPSQGFALGLGYLLFGSVFPWHVQAAGGNPVTDVSGQHREDPFGGSAQHVYSALNPEGCDMLLPERELPSPPQLALKAKGL